jgi:hypothetical protein
MPRPRKTQPTYILHSKSGRGRLQWYDAIGIRHEKLLPGPFGSRTADLISLDDNHTSGVDIDAVAAVAGDDVPGRWGPDADHVVGCSTRDLDAGQVDGFPKTISPILSPENSENQASQESRCIEAE